MRRAADQHGLPPSPAPAPALTAPCGGMTVFTRNAVPCTTRHGKQAHRESTARRTGDYAFTQAKRKRTFSKSAHRLRRQGTDPDRKPRDRWGHRLLVTGVSGFRDTGRRGKGS
ncbi:hypothetical protein GCM10018793_42320 [Streptomyces sulfonofaciens]|uniref:Uncharacterized protein n=1 Tax=Streptomyces sulfonofaciens TaxID=68272 RepID=A0A919L3E2_9ACTN|nr:hypothetical protein GCM10018793_42320 [Streptomyces sulfonofaciens]